MCPASQRTKRAERIVAQLAGLQTVVMSAIGGASCTKGSEDGSRFGAESGNAVPNHALAGEHARRVTSGKVLVVRFSGYVT